jgi:hypothetical protein
MMTKSITDEELDKIEKAFRYSWSCGCNAGGMCGCNLSDEGYFRQFDELKPRWGEDMPQTLKLIGEIRRLKAVIDKMEHCTSLSKDRGES